MEDLKKELLQAQITRDELMKWKLIVVSAVGAPALGFSASTNPKHAELALCLIPIACVYLDLLCRNLSIRSLLISKFLASYPVGGTITVELQFERFYSLFHERRKNSLEGFALLTSTLLLSLLVPPVGISIYFDGMPKGVQLIEWPSFLFIGAGLLGTLGSLTVERMYRQQQRKAIVAPADWRVSTSSRSVAR